MSHLFVYIITFVDVCFFGDAFIDGDLFPKKFITPWQIEGARPFAYDVENNWICLESSILSTVYLCTPTNVPPMGNPYISPI